MASPNPVPAARLMDRRLSDDASSPSSASDRVTLETLSYPPTRAELKKYVDKPPSELPVVYKRDYKSRIYVNRDLRMDKIKYFGFDMDYTLADYKSPATEALAHRLAARNLVAQGYPEAVNQFSYDPSFPQRGLILDKKLGNLIKIDQFGFILACAHGRKRLDKGVVKELYPSRIVREDEIGKGQRFFSLDTLFAMPEACLYADVVELLEKDVPADEMSFAAVFQDVRDSFDRVHADGSMKEIISQDIATYIHKDARLGQLLHQLRVNGCLSFLLTNSDYKYTNAVMSYLLDDLDPATYPSWRHYFDVVIVNAMKPLFFRAGTQLREVDLNTGMLKLSKVEQGLSRGKVYSGGSMEKFERLMGGLKGGEVLYVGDHIYGDILIPKKSHSWRTLLIIRELEQETQVASAMLSKYNHLLNLEFIRAETYRDMDFNVSTPPDIRELHDHIQEVVEELDMAYNVTFGSMFRSGSKQTFFSMQVQRYADLYASRAINLVNYPPFYFFVALNQPMPHEFGTINALPQAPPQQGDDKHKST
eukprot:GILI01005491.1.p2 GENE.GILI01005491.1~~GILI01005491.1.p2  ORF type:complete len:552 (+),score=206.83 GILI01005491.1:56-1657(+)